MDQGLERIGLEIKTTGHNSNTRLPISGMTDRELTIRLADALGTTSPEFIDSMLVNLLTYFNAPTDRRATREINSALAVLDGLKPENEVEAMLITQMVATNDAAMKCLSQINSQHSAEIFGNLAVKIMRTFTGQAEALAKLRRKGEQTVRVVHVHPGGQAVVGDVHNHPAGGRGQITESGDQSDAAGNFSAGAALPGPNAIGETVPIPRRRRAQKVPDARRDKSGRAQGQPA
ncbi:hypothetical protein KRZ98_03955 [Sphingobium sp. AS12]|nr:hypothetical protein [Sphingobium sp. AS12]